jgi:hypothetical protein
MAKELKWNNTKNTIDRHSKDDVYKITDINGNVRLIKDTGENFFEINPNNGSEIREITTDEASRLIPNNANPLTFEQKTELLKDFDANFDASFNPDNNSGYMPSNDLKGENRLANQQAREKSGNWEATGTPYGGEGNTYFGIKPDPNIGGESGLDRFENSQYALPGKDTSSVAAIQAGTVETKIPILSQETIIPQLDEKTLTVGEGGDPGLFQVDDDFYRTKDGTLMKDGGWFTGDTEATQADIDAGIVDQNSSSPWGSTAGWNAAGSVMKGVGGLASAYTNYKNYQLAEKAHDTQKKQWQANYDQRLRAYQDNKDLANMDIASRNRTLLARNPNRTDLYKELK